MIARTIAVVILITFYQPWRCLSRNVVIEQCPIQDYAIDCLSYPTYTAYLIINDTFTSGSNYDEGTVDIARNGRRRRDSSYDMYCCIRFWLNKYHIIDISNRIIIENTLSSSMVYSCEYLSSLFVSLARPRTKNRIESRYEHSSTPTVRHLSNMSSTTSYFEDQDHHIDGYTASSSSTTISVGNKVVLISNYSSIGHLMHSWHYHHLARLLKSSLMINLFIYNVEYKKGNHNNTPKGDHNHHHHTGSHHSHHTGSHKKIKYLPYGVRRSAMQKLIESNHTHIERSKLISCYIHVNDNNKQKKKYHNNDDDDDTAMYDQCVRLFDHSMCHHHCVNITTLLPDVTSEYITSLRQSKLIIVISSLDNCHSHDWTKMTSAWIAEAMMAGAMPIVNMSCFLSNNKIDLRAFKKRLPIIDLNAYQQSKTITVTTPTSLSSSLSLSSSAAAAAAYDPSIKLLAMYNDIIAHSDQYSRAPFYLSFWLHQLLPINETASHINRGISKHHEFIHTYIPRVHNYMLHRSNKLSSSLSVVDTKEEQREMCELPKSRKPVPIIPSRLVDGGSRGNAIEIVIPRCCESLRGDLAWIHHLAASTKHAKQHHPHHPHHSLTISIYYKCPWCLPRSYLHDWLPSLINITNNNIIKNNRKNDNNNNIISDSDVHPSLKLSAIDKAHAVELIRSLGYNGIEVLEDFSGGDQINNSVGVVIREVPAFDLHVNGKEATAYLSHIINRYHSLADYTIFLHTQPAHHLEFERFTRLIIYLWSCHQSTDQSINLDYLSLNYRWFEGWWAHQPEMCMMHMLEHLFANSSLYGDPDRLPPPGDKKKSSQLFLDIPMASGVAAQFVTSRNAIQMRSHTWWEKLWKLNTGVDTIQHCDISTAADDEFIDLYKKGSDVASVMERIWHNFFLDRSSSSSSASKWERKDGSRKPLHALYCPDVRDHHWLSPYLTTAIMKPHHADNSNMMKSNGQGHGGMNGRGSKPDSVMMMKGKGKRGGEAMGMMTQNKRDGRDGGSRGKLGPRGIT